MFVADAVASPSLLDSLLALASLLQAAAALVLAGAVPGYLQRRLMSEPRDPRIGLLYIAVLLPVSGLLLALIVPGLTHRVLAERLSLLSDWTAVSGLHIAVMMLLAASGMMISAGWWDRVYAMGIRRAPRETYRLLPITAVMAGVASVVLLFWPVAPLPDGHAGPWLGGQPLALLFIAGLNAGGLARALANHKLDRIASVAVAIPPTAGAVVLTYWLLSRTIYSHNLEWQAGQQMLGYHTRDAAGLLGRTLGRWALIYSCAVFFMGLGGWLGIRLAPRPVIRSTRRDMEEPIVPPPPPFATTEPRTGTSSEGK